MSAVAADLGGRAIPVAPGFSGGRDIPLGARVLLTGFVMAVAAGFAPSAPLTVPERRAVEVRRADGRSSHLVDAQGMVEHLRALGFPVSAIADVLDVERKTVYSWAEGGVPNPANAERLSRLFDLLRDEPDGSLRHLHRLWERALPDGGTLRAILTAPEIDLSQAQAAVQALRPAMSRAMRTAKAAPAPSAPEVSAASHLTSHLVADSHR